MRHLGRSLAAALAAALMLASATVASAVPLANTASRTAAEVRTRWATAKPAYTGTPFLVAPSIAAPYAAGQLQPGLVQDALNKANFARYLVGLPGDVTIDAGYADEVQHSAVVLAAIGTLTHTPAKPADMPKAFFDIGYAGTTSSNLAAGSVPLHGTVDMYLDDGDASNIAVLGHRRWVLNPAMAKTGFGYAKNSASLYGAFSAMHAFDTSRADAVAYTNYGWPAAGAFPLQFFADGTPWSVQLDPRDYDYVGTGIVVTLTRVADGAHWTFNSVDTAAGTSGSGEYFNFDQQGFGEPACIVFRPALTMHYKAGDAFDVHVSGKLYANGTTSPVQIDYRTMFFDLDSTVDPAPGPTAAATSLSAKAGATSLRVGKYVTISSVLSGGVPVGTHVRYQVRLPGKTSYVTISSTRDVSATGASSVRYKLAKKGAYYFQARFLGVAGFAPSISKAVKVVAK